VADARETRENEEHTISFPHCSQQLSPRASSVTVRLENRSSEYDLHQRLTGRYFEHPGRKGGHGQRRAKRHENYR
jgi:hypothetical protein